MVTKNWRPSAQGGVVREPVYEDMLCALMAATKGAKSMGPVSVIVPGVSISAILEVASVRREVVWPVSESWKWVAMTAMEPSEDMLVSFI